MNQRFLTVMLYSSIARMPQGYSWTCPNRQAFYQHLAPIQGVHPWDQQFLRHYRRMNYYLDSLNIQLLPQELQFFQQRLITGMNVPVIQLLSDENTMFEQTAGQFQAGTDNYILRAQRPDWSNLPFPLGNLNTK